jgi:hypothetical protein
VDDTNVPEVKRGYSWIPAVAAIGLAYWRRVLLLEKTLGVNEPSKARASSMKARGIASDIPTRRRFAFQITLFQQHSREYGAKNNAVNRERYRQKFLKSALGISLEGRLSHKVGAVSKDR